MTTFVSSKAEPNSATLACSSDNNNNNSSRTTFLLEKAIKLLRGSKRKSSPSPSCSVNSPLCEKVARNKTGISSSPMSKTDDLLLEMSLGGNKELWEMHWLKLEGKLMKEFSNDKTGNNSTILSSPSVSSPFPDEGDNVRNRGLDPGAPLHLQMEVNKRLREQPEFLQDQRQLDLQIEKQGKFLHKSGFEEKIVKFFGNDETGNNKMNLSQPSSRPIISIPTVVIGDVRNKRLDVSEAFRLPRGFVKWQREQSEEIQKLGIVPNKLNISRRKLLYMRRSLRNLPKYKYNHCFPTVPQ